jgi:glutathione-independent formaldehyde dehydrogenase
VEEVPQPSIEAPGDAIVRITTTNICGSDLHMYEGRTNVEQGKVLGHENTGIVEETGPGVSWIKPGDRVSVPFNIACGTCRNCVAGWTSFCLRTNPTEGVDGAAYGYAQMGPYQGGQAEYLRVPFADFNLLPLPPGEEFEQDFAMLSDIFPTGYHGAYTAGVTTGSTVYVAGAGPVGLACAASCHLLGAAVVIVGDMIPERLAQARSFGCETVDLKKDASLADQIAQILGVPEVDSAVDCVGFEARGHGHDAGKEQPATVLNSVMTVTRAGGAIGIPGLYVTDDPGGVDANAKIGNLGIRIGLGWAKSHTFATGQCPVMRYHRGLMQAILHDKVQIAKAVNATMISLDQGPEGYKDFDKGAAKKYVIDPHKMVA